MMNKRRNIEMAKYKKLGGIVEQEEEQYKEMVEALLARNPTWDNWQKKNKNPPMIFYDFQYFNFFHEIRIGWAKFIKPVNFQGAKFYKPVNFLEVEFKNEAGFQEAKFNKEAGFQQVTFDQTANFTKAIFAKEVNFGYTTFQSSGFFTGAKFDGDIAHFSQMILSPNSNLLFLGAKFKNAVPDFRHLNRTPDIRFHGFSVPSPNKLIKKWESYNEDRYRKLKELAIGNHNHEYELMFYGYEMDSKLKNFYRRIEKIICNKKWQRFLNKKWWGFLNKRIICNKKWWADVLPTHLYQWFSNYGQSMWRPLICLAVLAVIFYNPYLNWNAIFQPILFLLSFLPFINNIDWVMICKTILPLPLFTFSNAVDVSGNSSIRLISDGAFAIKTIASFFWFLFFLGLRNKFKIK